MADPLPLFPAAPVQLPPSAIYTDGFLLERCRRCRGTRQEKCPWPGYYYLAKRWDPACRGCNATGKTLRRVWMPRHG